MKTPRMSMIAAIALVLAGCGGPTGSPTTAPPGTQQSPGSQQSPGGVSVDHNPADVSFAQGMVPHHRQAVEMARLATDRAASPQVKELAGRIEQAQGPEIEQLTGMLEAWGAPAPGESGGMAGMDHGGSGGPGMPGMMTGRQMGQLQQATGGEFDTQFLRMMVEHHRGAIQMAGAEVGQGRNAQARALAQKIVDDQRAEITTMDGLLGSR